MSEHSHDHPHEGAVPVAAPEFTLPPQFLVAGFRSEVERLNVELAKLNDNRVYLIGLCDMKDAVISSLSEEVERLRATQTDAPVQAVSNGKPKQDTSATKIARTNK